MWCWTAGGEGDELASKGGAARSGAVLAGGSPAGGMLGLRWQFDPADALARAVT